VVTVSQSAGGRFTTSVQYAARRGTMCAWVCLRVTMADDRNPATTPASRRARRCSSLALFALLTPLAALACDCFTPEARAKTAQETLQKARVAVYGRVIEVGTAGVAKVRVLESFKGPPVDAVLELHDGGVGCAAPQALQLGEEALVLSFGDTVSACDRHPRDHYLVEILRARGANAR